MTDNATTPHDDALDGALRATEAAVGQALGAVFDSRAGLEQIKNRIRQVAEPPASEAQAGPPDPGRGSGSTHPVAPSSSVLKILVAGGFGAGKTTLVRTVSEITRLQTEAALSEHGRPHDMSGLVDKHTTTGAMDFGRLTLREDIVLYLFGTPSQERFRSMWDKLSKGAHGAVVLVDTRRLEECFAVIDYLEGRSIPFVVGVNCFDGAWVFPAEDIRQALELDVPVVLCDPRKRESVTQLLALAVRHAMPQVAERHQSITS